MNGFWKLEKDLVPLIEIDRQISYQLSPELRELVLGKQLLQQYLDYGFKEPNQTLEKFKQYSFLMEKSTASVKKQLFGSEE